MAEVQNCDRSTFEPSDFELDRPTGQSLTVAQDFYCDFYLKSPTNNGQTRHILLISTQNKNKNINKKGWVQYNYVYEQHGF